EVRIALRRRQEDRSQESGDRSQWPVHCRKIAITIPGDHRGEQKFRNTSTRFLLRNTAKAANPAARIFEMMSPLSGALCSKCPIKELPSCAPKCRPIRVVSTSRICRPRNRPMDGVGNVISCGSSVLIDYHQLSLIMQGDPARTPVLFSYPLFVT